MTSEDDLMTTIPVQTTTQPTNQTQTTQNNNLDDFDFDAVIEVEDSSADFAVASAPPKAGIWPFKFKLNRDKKQTVGGREFVGVIPGKDKNGINFVGAHLLLNLIDPDNEAYNGFQIGEYVNSIKPRNKPTSALHSLANYLGEPIENKESIMGLVNKLNTLFDSEPTGYAELEWKAVYKSSKDGKWKDIHTRMVDFPRNQDGGYSNQTENPETGETVYAFAYIRRFVKNPNV
jgi:hypothetical protein